MSTEESREGCGTSIDTLRLWELLYPSLEGYLVTFVGRQSERPDARSNQLEGTQQRSWRYPADAAKAAAYLAAKSEAGHDVYFGVHLYHEPIRRGVGRTKEKALDKVSALWCDGDGAQFPGGSVEPHIDIKSSPGRNQFYVLLSRPVPGERAEDLCKRLTYWIGGDKGKWCLTTLLRPPGTNNYKRKEPSEVTGQVLTEERWDPDELDRLLPPLEEGKPDSTAGRAEPTTRTDGTGPPIRLKGKALDIFEGRVPIMGDSGVDRSATLMQIGSVLYNAGLERPGLVPALEERDKALGYEKFTRRPTEYDRIVDKLEASGREAPSPGPGSSGGTSSPASSSPPPPTPQSYPLTDTGNAERLVARHGKDIRYCYARKTWYVWDGVCWVRDEGGEVMRRAKETARSIYAEAAAETDADMRKPIARHARLSESRRAREAMVALAQPEPGVSVAVEELDRDLWLFNVPNGTIDLRSGELRKHRREDMITKLSPVAYDPDARSEVLDRYMGFATGGKPGLAEFIWRAVGYSLTGDTRQKALFFLHGPKNTGKTTFVEAVRATLGDYADTLDFRALLSYSRGDGAGPRPEIAKLPGTRFVASSEVREGSRLATELIKALTGWDTIEVRTLHEKPFSFTPQCKLWLAANYAPRVPEDDEAAWERIHRVPFDNEPEVKEPEVASHLRDPARGGPAVLAAAVRGCADFRQRGLAPPETVRRATREYRREQDALRGFLDEYCVLGNGLWVPTGQLREAYEDWARENGETNLLKGRKWGDRLKAHGCEPARAAGGGTRIWRGIALVGGPEEPDSVGEHVRAVGGMTDSENEETPANSGQSGEPMTDSTPESESFSHDPLAEESSGKNPSQSVIRRESVTGSPGDGRREQLEAVEWDEAWANDLMERAARYVAERHVEGDDLVDDTAELEETGAAMEAEDPARYRAAVRALVRAQLREFRLRREAAETTEGKTAGDNLAQFLEDPPGWWQEQSRDCLRRGSPWGHVSALARAAAGHVFGDHRRAGEVREAVEEKLREMAAGEACG